MDFTNCPNLNLQIHPRPASVSMTRPLNAHHERAGGWGWVIYRTIYTPESDEQWEEVKRQLDELILSDFEGFHGSIDPGSFNVAREKYRNYILED
jgi:hypothetical protein